MTPQDFGLSTISVLHFLPVETTGRFQILDNQCFLYKVHPTQDGQHGLCHRSQMAKKPQTEPWKRDREGQPESYPPWLQWEEPRGKSFF